jgi:threonine/homoserine/homoserine lactone efflux protein
MPLELYLAYVFACLLIAIIPGPTVTVIIGNSLKYGMRAGLLNVAGTQLGLALMMLALIVGLASVIAAMGWIFDVLRYAGAAYLVWLGWKLLHFPIDEIGSVTAPRGGFFLQGFLVMMANPKALLFFGAFIPQFVDPKGNYVAQIALLGGRAGVLLSKKRVQLVSRLSGACLIGGGLWLALTRAR